MFKEFNKILNKFHSISIDQREALHHHESILMLVVHKKFAIALLTFKVLVMTIDAQWEGMGM